MALTVDLEFTSEAQNESLYLGTLTDATVYGGANPARADVAVYLTGEKIKADGTVDYDLTVDTYTPTSATTFTFDIEDDGWHKFKFAIIPDWNVATAYVTYDVVNDAGVVYQAIGATTGNQPPNASYWSVVTTPTDVIDSDGTAAESGNLQFQVLEQIIYPFSKVGFGNACEAAALECCSDCERGEDVKLYEIMGVFVDAMSICNQREKFAKGEKIALKSAELIEANDLA